MQMHNRTRKIVVTGDDTTIINRIKDEREMLERCPCCTKHARIHAVKSTARSRKRKLAKQDRTSIRDYHVLVHSQDPNGDVVVTTHYVERDHIALVKQVARAAAERHTGMPTLRVSIQADTTFEQYWS